jgi:hypothetical protein
MKASFGKDISTKLTKTKEVWHTDATYRDVSGTATMTEKETADNHIHALQVQVRCFAKSMLRFLIKLLITKKSEIESKLTFNSKGEEQVKRLPILAPMCVIL